MKYTVLWFGACFVWNIIYSGEAAGAYFGKSLGKLSEFHHGVSGHVYAVDGRTLFIKDFTYDGEGPAAFFYVGNSKAPTNNGAIRLRDEKGSAGVLKRYRKKDITLSLPEGKTFHSIRWFSVWCDEFSVNFGDVKIPKNLDYPKPQKISGLSGVHEVSSDPIVIVDAQTLLIPNFSYDGEAPDAKFWVGRGSKPSSQGIRIPDENGKTSPLRKYDHKTIVLTLPQDLTVFDMGHFGVWCEAFTVDFGHIQIPEVTNVPPSLKMLGVSPQKRNQELVSSTIDAQPTFSSGNKSQKRKGQHGSEERPTTYRPPTQRFLNGANLEPASHREQVSRFESPLNVNDANFQLLYPVAPSAIHRRADNFQPARDQQLQRDHKDYGHKSIIQPSMEIYYRQDPPQYAQVLIQQPQQYLAPAVQYQQYRSVPLYQTHQVHPKPYQFPTNYQIVPTKFDLDLGEQSGRSFSRFSGNPNANPYVQYS